MSGRRCRFTGGPANGREEWVDDATRTVSWSPQAPLPGITEVLSNKVPPTFERTVIHTYRRSEVRPELFIYQGEDGKPKRPVPFTQYLMPDGRREAVEIEMPHDVADKADQLRARHLVLECEVLRTGEVSVTISDQEEEMDVDIRVTPNGPAVPEAIMDMIRRFDLEGYRRA